MGVMERKGERVGDNSYIKFKQYDILDRLKANYRFPCVLHCSPQQEPSGCSPRALVGGMASQRAP